MKTTFELQSLTCGLCGEIQVPPTWSISCRGCGNGSFTVEIERSASGIDLELTGEMGGGTVGELIELATDDRPDAGMSYRTHAILCCDDVSGDEIAEFMRLPVPERRSLYVSWKRREIESRLDDDHEICVRCRVSFKVYPNEWNGAGLCSKTCYAAFSKSRAR